MSTSEPRVDSSRSASAAIKEFLRAILPVLKTAARPRYFYPIPSVEETRTRPGKCRPSLLTSEPQRVSAALTDTPKKSWRKERNVSDNCGERRRPRSKPRSQTEFIIILSLSLFIARPSTVAAVVDDFI